MCVCVRACVHAIVYERRHPTAQQQGQRTRDKMDSLPRPLTAHVNAQFKSCAPRSLSSHLYNTSIEPHCCHTLGPINGMDYVREALVLEGSLCPWPVSHRLSSLERLTSISCHRNANTVGPENRRNTQKKHPPAIQLPCLLTGPRQQRVNAVCTW